MKPHVRTTCPSDCHDGCGVLVELDGDRIRRVLGDPDHPVSRGKLCAKCAFAHKGHWPKLEDGGAKVNALVPALCSDMGESTSVHGTLVQIAPA